MRLVPTSDLQPRSGSPWYDSSVDTVRLIPEVLPLFTFPLIISFGVGLGLIWSVWPVSAIPSLMEQRFNIGVICLSGALIGGRIGTIIINWRYYQSHLVEISQVWLGGIAWEGAISGSIVAILIAAHVYRTSLGRMADGLLPLLACITASAWLASWMTGYAYGVETSAWWGIPALDEGGMITKRWPTQLAGALLTLGVHWAIENLKARGRIRTPGMAASLELAGIAAIILIIFPFQAATHPLWRGVPLTAWFSMGILALSAVVAITASIRVRLSRRTS